MAFSGSQVTRLGLSGITRGLYGSFAGKVEAVVEAVTNKVGRRRQAPKKFRDKRLEDLVAALLLEREGGTQNLRAKSKYKPRDMPEFSYETRIIALQAELFDLVEKIKVKTQVEIDYKKYLLQTIETKRQQDEDELIMILLMAA